MYPIQKYSKGTSYVKLKSPVVVGNYKAPVPNKLPNYTRSLKKRTMTNESNERTDSTIELEVSVTFNVFLEGYADKLNRPLTRMELFEQGLEVVYDDFLKNNDWVVGHEVKFVKVTYNN